MAPTNNKAFPYLETSGKGLIFLQLHRLHHSLDDDIIVVIIADDYLLMLGQLLLSWWGDIK